MPLSATIADCVNKGKDMVLYYNTGTCASPVFVEHQGIKGDMTLAEADDEEEVQRRSSASNIKEYVPGLTDVGISGTQITDGNYEGNVFLNSMRTGGVPRDVLVLTDDIGTVHAYGWRGKMWNFDRGISGPFQGEQEQSFSLKPAACSDCAVRAVKVLVAAAAADWDATAFA